MWIVLRNRHNHRYAGATPRERRSMYQPGDIIDLGDWEDPGRKVLQSKDMVAIEITNRTAAQFRQSMKDALVSRFGGAADAKFGEFFDSVKDDRRGWFIDLPTVWAGLTAAQRTWLKDHRNNISLTASQFANAFKAAIKRRPGSSTV